MNAPLDVVDGLQVVVAAEDQLGAQRCEGVERRLGVEPVAARELAADGVVVDHDDAGGLQGGVLEGFPDALDIRVPDVPITPRSLKRLVIEPRVMPWAVFRPAMTAPGTSRKGSGPRR